MNEPQIVSDPSQPKKIKLMKLFFASFVLVAIGLGIYGWKLLTAVRNIQLFQPPLGISMQEVSYSKVVNSQIACPAATSTLVLTTSTSRLSFAASNVSTGTISLCRDQTCTSAKGILLGATNTVPYIQNDAYIGPYSCAAPNVGTSSLNITYSDEN